MFKHNDPDAVLGARTTVVNVNDSKAAGTKTRTTETQIDLVLVNRDQKFITDAKAVLYETVPAQHRPMICTMKMAQPRQKG